MTNSEKVSRVLELMSSGMSENASCKEAGLSRSTFRTTALREGVGDRYAKALEALALDQIEKLEVTIDDMRAGVIDHNMARVEIDARKWFACKFLPKRFGDKLDMTTNQKEFPSPILPIGYVRSNDSNPENISVDQAITGATGGNV
jgi:hypothetical protein